MVHQVAGGGDELDDAFGHEIAGRRRLAAEDESAGGQVGRRVAFEPLDHGRSPGEPVRKAPLRSRDPLVKGMSDLDRGGINFWLNVNRADHDRREGVYLPKALRRGSIRSPFFRFTRRRR
jgi:hypothetical protein